MRRLALTLGALALAGCSWSQDAALETYQAEVARDLGGEERDDEAAVALGRNLQQGVAELKQQREGLTLSDCFRLALASSERLRAGAERVLDVDLQRREAIATVLPQVSLYGTHNKDSNTISLGGGGSFQSRERTSYGFRVTQRLFDPTILPTLSVLAETRQIQALDLRAERDRVLFAVASDFYEVLGLEADLAAISASLESARESERVLAARAEQGLARDSDLLLARASRAESEARHIQREADLRRAKARLRTRLDVDALPPLVDTYAVTTTPDALPRLVDRALAQRYELSAARHAVAAAEKNETLAFSDYLPRVDLTFNHLTESEEGFNRQLDWTLGVNLSWTLFDGGGREARVARARRAIRERQLELRELERQVRLEVEEAALAFRSLDRALFAFRARAEAARAAHDVTTARQSGGSATLLELLTAREAQESATRDLVRADLGRKLAALRIRLAAGDFRRAAPTAHLVNRP